MPHHALLMTKSGRWGGDIAKAVLQKLRDKGQQNASQARLICSQTSESDQVKNSQEDRLSREPPWTFGLYSKLLRQDGASDPASALTDSP